MICTCETNHSSENEEPLLLAKYRKQIVSVRIIVTVAVVRDKSLQKFVVAVLVDRIFYLKE